MTWSPMHAQIHALLRKRSLIPTGSRILMAVSGGQDSVCMAQMMVDLCDRWSWTLAIVHCDHGWQTESTEVAQQVMKLASERWQIPGWCKRAIALPKTEAAARTWRYEQFEHIARQHEFNIVITGHTASDRAETVLYNLIRGSGTDGLGSLDWVRSLSHSSHPSPSDIQLVRPLLQLYRQDTANFCKTHKLPTWQDPSNQDLSYRRNRIRQELIPYLQTHFNPQVEQALSQFGDITAADSLYLEEQTAATFKQVITSDSEPSLGSETSEWQIDRKALSSTPVALQRRVLRQLLSQALDHMPTFAQIETVRSLLLAPNRSQSPTLAGGWTARVDGSTIHLSKTS